MAAIIVHPSFGGYLSLRSRSRFPLYLATFCIPSGELGGQPVTLRPIWTTEKPTDPGWYWYRNGKNDIPHIVEVFVPYVFAPLEPLDPPPYIPDYVVSEIYYGPLPRRLRLTTRSSFISLYCTQSKSGGT
jgi:hypothetical protein